MSRTRAAFTLTELLVALAVVLVLAGIAALVLPGAVTQDRTTDGAATVRQLLMSAKAMAGKDGLPRGVRFIVTLDPNTPAKRLDTWVTELQYIETPPVLVANPNQRTWNNVTAPPITPPNPLPPGFDLTSLLPSPLVEVLYTVNAIGAITNRQLFIRNLSPDQANQVQAGALLGVPEFNNYWCRVLTATQSVTGPNTRDVTVTVPFNLPQVNEYPDDYMGASTQAVSYRFGIYGLPQPLVAEPNVALPRNICVDLTPAVTSGTNINQAPSVPAGTSGLDYDILFAPNGQVLNRGAGASVQGQIFLWVRDYTKAANPLVVLNAGPPLTYDLVPFQGGGEQQLVALKVKSGAVGTFPVLWPNQAGQYAANQDPYSFARQGATAP